MENVSLYSLAVPATWASAPAVFSYSSIHAIEECPLRWQLENSLYEGLGKYPRKPNRAAAEGQIVHSCLEVAVSELAGLGFPELGGAESRELFQRLNLGARVDAQRAEFEKAASANPRGRGFRWHSTRQQILNQVVRLLREQYPSLKGSEGRRDAGHASGSGDENAMGGEELLARLMRRGALSEVELSHPRLPFRGIIDLVYRDGDELVLADFKSGLERPGHERQVRWYSVLFWRVTTVAPARAEIIYAGSRAVSRLTEADLKSAEADLRKRIADAGDSLRRACAVARPGEGCRWCDVRQLCDTYWKATETGDL